MPSAPICITIAGSDSCAGAGIQADIKTFAQLGCYGMSVITASTAQTHLGVNDMHVLPVKHVEKQLSSLLRNYRISAIKTGMLASAEHIAMISDVLSHHPNIPLICDPVLGASSGADWSCDSIKAAYIERLAPISRLFTPNLDEATRLFTHYEPNELSEEMASELRVSLANFSQSTGSAILLKGGHIDPQSNLVLDRLFIANKDHKSYQHERVRTANNHGTGCTLASAVASFTALGHDLEDSVSLAIQYLQKVIKQSQTFLHDQAGEPAHNLPMNHFYTQ